MAITPDSGDDTRRLIARADPSVALIRLRSDELTRLLETNMTNTPTTSAPYRSTRRGWVIGTVSGLTALSVVALAIPFAVGSAMDATPLEQPASVGPAAMCAEVTAEAIAAYDTAFSAEVTSIEDGSVTLTVQDRYHGEVKNTITVPQGNGSGIDGESLMFVDEGDYLISARESTVITCGVSGEYTPALATLYQQAFPR